MGVLVRNNLLNIKQSRLFGLVSNIYVTHGCTIPAVFLILGSLFVPLWAGADAIDQRTDYKAQAAYIYNFAKFTRWPLAQVNDGEIDAEVETASFYICILGLSSFGDAFEAMKGKPGADTNIVVRHINQVPLQNECQVLFISQSENHQLPALLHSVADQPVLTVSDIEGFAIKGGCIELTKTDGKIAFSINLQSADRAHLKFSARLLELAKVVIDK